MGAGRKLPIDGGESTGAGTVGRTLDGTFADADLSAYPGVAIRCDALWVPFGRAAPSPV